MFCCCCDKSTPSSESYRDVTQLGSVKKGNLVEPVQTNNRTPAAQRTHPSSLLEIRMKQAHFDGQIQSPATTTRKLKSDSNSSFLSPPPPFTSRSPQNTYRSIQNNPRSTQQGVAPDKKKQETTTNKIINIAVPLRPNSTS